MRFAPIFGDVWQRIVVTAAKKRFGRFAVQPVVVYEAAAHREISHLVVEHRETNRRTLHEQSRLGLVLLLQGDVFDQEAGDPFAFALGSRSG